MPWHLLISGQPAEERHPRRQARIRGPDPGFDASQRPLRADGKAHPRTAAQAARSPGESVPAFLPAISTINIAIVSISSEWAGSPACASCVAADQAPLSLTCPRPGLVITTRNG